MSLADAIAPNAPAGAQFYDPWTDTLREQTCAAEIVPEVLRNARWAFIDDRPSEGVEVVTFDSIEALVAYATEPQPNWTAHSPKAVVAYLKTQLGWMGDAVRSEQDDMRKRGEWRDDMRPTLPFHRLDLLVGAAAQGYYARYSV